MYAIRSYYAESKMDEHIINHRLSGIPAKRQPFDKSAEMCRMPGGVNRVRLVLVDTHKFGISEGIHLV